eukprot:9730883-Lingulodinium_polyedra.AAC.1
MEDTCARAVVAHISKQSVARKPRRDLNSTHATNAATLDGGERAAGSTAAGMQPERATAHDKAKAD